MCSPIRCRTCGLTTWSGCGAHVDEVKAMVPPEQWCGGHDDAPAAPAAPKRRRFF